MKLKPCPFCGEIPTVELIEAVWSICCENMDCPADAVCVYEDTEAEAIKAWNTRPEIEFLESKIKELEHFRDTSIGLFCTDRPDCFKSLPPEFSEVVDKYFWELI